ncbi:response regulator transcription factor [Shimia marina]|uniref:Nitrogen regulation protein C n=1 Tax=Shimia marina TaxID=321267 RepID=A0A0P1ER90_9RHOB|nr:response regulator transcription factor [Shimia marina]CUH53007.1 Nitrogen regulation protein C [Shimia marina]SFD92238.1 two component transcriptional regulator, LuxR family [Shimia marina]
MTDHAPDELPEHTPDSAVKVVIVDDHPMVAEGIESILESYEGIAVVGTLSNGREAVDQLPKLRPDVVLMDLNMPEIGGLTATEMLLERDPDLRVLILSMHDSPEYISTALSHGAMGYVLKDVPTEEIKTAIDAVMRGERYLCTGAQGSLAPSKTSEREPLTSREQTVLLELAQGKSNKQVAIDLDISVRTVETHRKNIKRKLGISSTAGLTRYAMEHGVLQGTGVRL